MLDKRGYYFIYLYFLCLYFTYLSPNLYYRLFLLAGSLFTF